MLSLVRVQCPAKLPCVSHACPVNLPGSQLWPFAPFLRLGDPSEPSLARESLVPYSPNPAPDRPAGRTGTSLEPHRGTSYRR